MNAGIKGHNPSIRQVCVQRFSVVSTMSFERVVSMIEAAVGHPDIVAFTRDITTAKTFTDLERVVQNAVGPSGLMEFARYDIGNVLSKERGTQGPHILRLVIGNPLIMKRMVEHVPDAASYAPVTVLIDERPDGVHVSYDRMSSLLAPYESAEALTIARDLDTKIETMLTATAVKTENAAW